MDSNCLICKRIGKIKKGSNPYFVKELKSGYVVMADHQFYEGYTLFLSKTHVRELHELKNDRETFLNEMALVAEAVYKAFRPNKLNYELLGNTDSHLHWHIIPRYADDPNRKLSIWETNEQVRCTNNSKPSENNLLNYKNALLQEINKLI